MQFHSKQKASLRLGVALSVLCVGLAGCGGGLQRHSASEYEEVNLPPKEIAVVVTPGLPIASQSGVQRGVVLPSLGDTSEPQITGTAEARANPKQIWQPTFASRRETDSAPAGARVPIALAKSPTTQAGGWTAVGGQRVRLKPNESVETLSWHHRVPVDEILHANKVTVSSALQPGDTVVIPVRVASEPRRTGDPTTTGSIPGHYANSLTGANPASVAPRSTTGTGLQVAQALIPPGNVGERSRPVVNDGPPPAYPAPAPAQPAPSYQRTPVSTLPASSLEPVRPAARATPTFQQNSLKPLTPVAPASNYGAPHASAAELIKATPKVKPRVAAVRQASVSLPETASQNAIPTAKSRVVASKPASLAPARTAAVAQPVQPVRSAPAATQPTRSLANSLAPKPVQTAAVQPDQRALPPALPESETDITQLEQPKATPSAPVATTPAKPQQVAAVQSDTNFRWPVRGRIVSDFGVKPGGSRNDGINLAVPSGTDIKAAEDGTVVYAGNELKGFGNLVLVRHDNGWVSAYAHNKQLNVRRGDVVKRGQTIAQAGATGSVTQPQLHFELRKDNKPVNPMDYLPSS